MMAPHLINDHDLIADEASFSIKEKDKTLEHHFTKTNKPRVRFADACQVHETLSRTDYYQYEAENSWYSPEEKYRLQRKYEKTVERMEKGFKPKKGTSYRGLENLATDNANFMIDTIHECIDAVMDEQELQWNKKIFDWNRFAVLSQKVSEESIRLALKMAQYDERRARKAYKKMNKDKMSRRTSEQSLYSSEQNMYSSQRSLYSSQRSLYSSQRSLISDDSTVCTEASENTLVHDIKRKHHGKKNKKKTSSSDVPRKKRSRRRNEPLETTLQ